MGKKYALIIAAGHYQHPERFSLLHKTTADAEGMAAILNDDALGAFDHVTTLVDQPDRDVRVAVEKFFVRKQADDLLLLYFAGHGIRSPQGSLRLALVSTDPDAISQTSIDCDWLCDTMNNSRSKRQLIILDCCFSGAFGRDNANTQAEAERAFAVGDVELFDSAKQQGRFVITATDKTSLALERHEEHPDTDNAILTGALIEGVRSGKAADDAGNITVLSLYRHLKKAVHHATQGQQAPKLKCYVGDGDMMLVPSRHPPLPEEVLALTRDRDADTRLRGVAEIKRAIAGNTAFTEAGLRALEALASDRDTLVQSEALEAIARYGKSATAPLSLSAYWQRLTAHPNAEQLHTLEREIAVLVNQYPDEPELLTLKAKVQQALTVATAAATATNVSAPPPEHAPAPELLLSRWRPWQKWGVGLSAMVLLVVGISILDPPASIEPKIKDGTPDHTLDPEPNNAVTEPTPVKPKQARLKIDAAPSDATITLLESDQPYTPNGRLPRDKYQVRVEAPGYKSQTLPVDLRQGDQTLSVTLEKQRYRLTVNPNPARAEITLPDIKPSYRPGIALVAGQHRITVTAKGYRSRTVVADLRTGDQTLNVALEKISQPSGKVFRDPLSDGGQGPAMVVISAGSFTMGSPEDEVGRGNYEGPQRPVSVPRFALGQTEVTFTDYERFAKATNRQLPDDEGWGTGKRPVINVSWEDAKAYTQWLSEQTGHDYRLPTEAEWEYAARAGSATRFSYGDDPKYEKLCLYGNGADQSSDRSWKNENCDDGFQYTAPVASFQPNKFGLYDMHGNVWEWVEDCWHHNYKGAPTDGSAWREANGGNCPMPVVRGGSWYDATSWLRSVGRDRFHSNDGGISLGFRVARTLE